MKIIKRDGTKQEFNIQKIRTAIHKAFHASKGREIDIDKVSDWVYDQLCQFEVDNIENAIGIETIQDLVEDGLMKFGYFETAKSYIKYRESHKHARLLEERIKYMDWYENNTKNASASSETDPNANVSIKNASNLESEVWKTENRLIQRRRMKKMLNKLYPNEDLGHQYIQDLENHIIYTHDEASTPVLKNYCEAVTLYPLLTEGVGNMDGVTPGPPEHLQSFAGQINNLLFLLSAQCKGAVAFGEFFNFVDYFCVKDFGENYPGIENELATSPYVKYTRTIGQEIEQAFQTMICYWNQSAGNRGYQSPFSNISYYDSYFWHAMFDDFCFPDGSKPKWERVDYLQRKFMYWFIQERTKAVYTFPVETVALLTKDGEILDKAYEDFVCDAQAKGGSFFVFLNDNPSSLASCCRLRNDILDNVFSFTNGLTGVQTGSCNVITLNLSRIIQNYCKKAPIGTYTYNNFDFEGFKTYFEEIIERVHKYHIAFKTMLYEAEEHGMFTSCSAGYISMSKLYSTVGENGINEAAEYLGIEVSYNEEYKNFCRFITGTISEINKKNSTNKFRFNQEFVPAESLSSKNYNWDKQDGYWVPSNRVLYNSYFYNAHNNTSVLDKFKLHGREFTELLDGGVGLHCNLEDHLSKEQYRKLLQFAVDNGTSYYTFNIPFSECTNKECHNIIKVPAEICPKCGSPMRQWTRVVGFLRPVDKYDDGRKWDYDHRYFAKEVC